MKRVLSVILCVVLMLGIAPMLKLTVTASAKKITQYSRGDIIEYGWYPQSRVTDSNIIRRLYGSSPDWDEWNSYWYISQLSAGSFMRYVDIELYGQMYRGVRFTEYRPYETGKESSMDNTYQDDNGYTPNTIYWFKYEPLKWRVLDPSTGLVLCETIIDSQPINYHSSLFTTTFYDADEPYYANNYAHSTLRQWLTGWNGDSFLNTAFSTAQRKEMQITVLDNSACTPSNAEYDAPSTTDKIFLLSHKDALNENYGFTSTAFKSDSARVAKGTDYADCQGLFHDENGNPYWYLRSAGYLGYLTCGVDELGWVNYDFETYGTYYGVRPAFRMNLTSNITQSGVLEIGPEPLPEVEIEHYVESMKVDYRATVTFSATVENATAGAQIHWFVDGKDVGTGDKTAVKEAKKSYTIQAKYILDGETLAESKAEKVNVDTGFFAKLIAFFRSLFKKLPVIAQAYSDMQK